MPSYGITSQQQRFVEMPAALQSGLTVWLMSEDYVQGAAWRNRGSAPAATMVGSALVAPVKEAVSLNRRQVVRFKVNEGRYRGTGMCTDGSLPLTVIYVGRTWGSGLGRMFSGVYTGTYNFLVGTHSAGEPSLYDLGWAGNTPPPPAWGPRPTAWRIYAAVCATGPLTRFWVNGALYASTATSNGHPSAYALSGQDATTTTETSDCDIAEVLCWDRTLTVLERQDVETYLRAKWGLGVPPALTLTSISPTTTNISAGNPLTHTLNGSGFLQGDTQYEARHASVGGVWYGLATVVSPTVCTFLWTPGTPGAWSIAARSISGGTVTSVQTYTGTGVSPP